MCSLWDKVGSRGSCCLAAEAVQGAALPLQSVDDVHGGDGLPLGVLCVGDGISDDVLEEYFEYTSGFFIDESRDTLDTTTTSKTTDSWLGDTLDVITKNLPVTLGASFSKTLSSFTSSRHVDSSAVRLKLALPREVDLFIYQSPTARAHKTVKNEQKLSWRTGLYPTNEKSPIDEKIVHSFRPMKTRCFVNSACVVWQTVLELTQGPSFL